MISVSFRGVNYQIPEPGDANTQALTDYLNALSTGAVPFPTTADIDLGAAFGIKALDFKTRAANPAASGLVRLALADLIAWRNNANSADLGLGVGGQDQLQWRGSDITGNPCLIASSVAGATLGTGATTIVVYGTTELDTDAAYNSGTGVFTVPTGKGGHYVVTASVQFTAALTATDVDLNIFVAGVAKRTNRVANPAANQTLTVSAVVTVTAGQSIDIRAFQNSAGSATYAASAAVMFFTLKRITS